MSRRSVPRDHHAGFGIPSNARYRRHATPMREWDRHDPTHRPLEVRDVTDPVLFVEACVVFVAIVGFVLAISIVAVR